MNHLPNDFGSPVNLVRICWIAVLTTSALCGQATLLSLSNPGSGASASITTTFSTIRTEFRIENLSSKPTVRYVWGAGAFPVYNCQLVANSLILRCHFGGEGAPAGGTDVDLRGKTDVRVRWQRDPANQTYKIEVWNGDCTGYFSVIRPITNPLAPLPFRGELIVGDLMQVGFLRLYSTLNLQADCPIDAPAVTADLADFRFETINSSETLKDVSGHGYTLSARGASFVKSDTYPPQAVVSMSAPKPAFRAAQPLSLDGSTSSTFTGNGRPEQYLWQQIAGPVESKLASATDRSVIITPPIAGQYTYRLTVTDAAGRSSFTDQSVGVVGTDSNYVAVAADPSLAWALGPVTLHGTSPWPWYEITEAADVDLLSSVMMTPPTETPGIGTLSASTEVNKIDNQGLLTSEGAGNGGIVWTGSDTNFDQSYVGRRISIHWDPDGDGSYRGRRVTYITKVIDATTIVSNDYELAEPRSAVSGQGLSWGLLGSDFGPYNSTDPGGFIAMFYEAGLAVGRLYAKTGLEQYKDQFHAFCNNWWRYGLGSGFAYAIPRNSGVHTVLACAADPTYNAPTSLWDGIARVVQRMAGYVPTSHGPEPAYNPTGAVVAGTVDTRELSYVLRPTAILARLYGKRGGKTGTWCKYLENQVTNMWLSNAVVPGGAPSANYAYWEENLFLIDYAYVAASHPAGDPNGHFGTSPWRSAGLPALALTYAYEALNDPDACNNPELAKQLFNPEDGSGLIANAANYIWDYGRSADGGLLYAEGYETDAGNMPGWTVYNSLPANGTINLTKGSAAVVGTGSWFTAQFGPCDGSTQIKIRGATYSVASCADDTHMALTTPYDGPTAAGVRDYTNPATIAVTHGSAQVVGNGTKFTVLFAPCNGKTYIGIVGNKNQGVDRRVYQVMDCADDTHLTLNLPYAGPTESGVNIFSRARRAQENCGPLSISSYCEPDRYNGRNLSADVAASAAWLYLKTSNPLWRSRATYYANKTFGGAAGGSGAVGPPTGSCVYSRPGTISVTKGSAAVVGSGTQFTSQFSPCDGTTQITIGDATGTWANPPGLQPNFHTYKVMSCTDDTHLNLSAPYEGATRKDLTLFYNPGDPQWQCADGGTGNLGEILPSCRTSAPPCGAGALVPKYGKPLGMASGAGDMPLMLANLLGGPQLTIQMIPIEFDLTTVDSATEVRVTVTRPDGLVTMTTCTTSPCQIRSNTSLGRAIVKIDYLSADGSVLKSVLH